MNAQIKPVTDDQIIHQLDLKSIHPDPHQPRQLFDSKLLRQLSNDIKVRGVMQPISVRPDPDKPEKYIIIYGERRWRASKLAKNATIPAMIKTLEQDPIDILIDQVAENFQRDDLKPIEIAHFFNELHTTHSMPMKDIPAFLKKKGLKVMERSYISNTRRLLDLPDWAKDWINDGTLSPSHGKYILQAKAHDKVLETIKTEIDNSIKNEEHPPLISEMPELIDESFNEHYNDINQLHRGNDILFDPAEACQGCKTCKLIKATRSWYKDALYCFDETCLDTKTREAKEARDAERAEKKKQQDKEWQLAVEKQADSEHLDDEHLDVVTGDKLADTLGQAEDNTPEIPKTEAQIALEKGRIERTEEYLDSWLREQINKHLEINTMTRYKVILWKGAGAPGNWSYSYKTGIEDPDIDRTLEEFGINLTLDDHIKDADLETLITEATVNSMHRDQLRMLAHHCDIQLEGNYTVDAEFLNIKTKKELVLAVPDNVREAMTDDWVKETKRPTGELIDRLVEYAWRWGIPQDLQAMYDASKPVVSQEIEDH